MKWEKSADNRKAFTIVEVVIVLAITGLIFVGAVVGVSSGLARQRYNDAVQDITQKLRTQYDGLSRVQISERDDNSLCNYVFQHDGTFKSEIHRGRTDCSIYGVAVILGAEEGKVIQSTTLLGMDLPSYRDYIKKTNNTLHTIADIDAHLASMSTVRLLGELGVSNYYGNLTTIGSGGSSTTALTNCKVTNVLTSEKILWDSTLEKPNGAPAKYIILIVRSPRDGAVHTYVKELSASVADVTDYATADLSSCVFVNAEEDIRKTLVSDETSYKTEDLYLCIDSEDRGTATGVRRTLKIAADGHGASAVELVNLDAESDLDDENICAKCDEDSGDSRCN